MSNKSDENRVRRAAKREGWRLVKSRSRNRFAEDYGLYVLIHDSRGNRLPGAQAPYGAFARGEGMSLAAAADELDSIAG